MSSPSRTQRCDRRRRRCRCAVGATEGDGARTPCAPTTPCAQCGQIGLSRCRRARERSANRAPRRCL
eukprot:3093315-Pleurochrysis_carterae.AAC.1